MMPQIPLYESVWANLLLLFGFSLFLRRATSRCGLLLSFILTHPIYLAKLFISTL